MEEQLSRKRRVRAGHRASVSRIISQVYENMEGSDDPERKLSKARQQDNALKEKLQVLRTLDSEILELTVADDDVVEEIQKADEYAERLQLALIDLERVLKESKSRPSSPGVRQPENRPLSPGVRQPENRPSSPGGRQSGMFGQEQVIINGSEQTSRSAIRGTSTRSEFKAEPWAEVAGYSQVNREMIASPTNLSIEACESQSNYGHNTRPRIKLPKLTLRKFNGDITNWITFWDSYESTIHLNPELSAVDKFNYLTSLVEKTAAETIAGLSVTSLTMKRQWLC